MRWRGIGRWRRRPRPASRARSKIFRHCSFRRRDTDISAGREGRMAGKKKHDGKVLLVGSINLNSVDEVFKSAGRILGPHLDRIPDGEPGARSGWITFNYGGLRVHRAFEPDPDAGLHTGVTLLRLRPNVKKSDMVFGELGYAREAKGSYVDFVKARKAGTIPKDVRFQVCLPTPFAVTVAFFSAATQPIAEKMYEA